METFPGKSIRFLVSALKTVTAKVVVILSDFSFRLLNFLVVSAVSAVAVAMTFGSPFSENHSAKQATNFGSDSGTYSGR